MNRDMESSHNIRVPPGVLAFVLLLAFLWGGNIVALKVGLTGIPPFAAAGLRFSIALPLIAAWATFRRTSLVPTRRELRGLLFLSAVFVVQIVLINVGTSLTLAGRSTVFLNAYPVYVALISHFFVPGDMLTKKKSVGLVAAFAGVIAPFAYSLFAKEGTTLAGDAMVIASGILLAVIVVMINRITQNTPPVRMLTTEMVIGIPIFFLLSLLFESGTRWRFSPGVVAAFGYQGAIVGALCFIAWSNILKKQPPSKVSAVFFTTPLWGVLLSYLVLQETISVGLIVGAGLVALGIYLVNAPRK